MECSIKQYDAIEREFIMCLSFFNDQCFILVFFLLSTPIEFLSDWCLLTYHHHWNENLLIIIDQWLMITHKRAISELFLSLSPACVCVSPEGFTSIAMLFYNEFLRKQNINMCRDQTHHLAKTTTTTEILYCRQFTVCMCVCAVHPLATA